MANSPISPRLIRWAFLTEASQSSRILRASIRNDLPAGVSAHAFALSREQIYSQFAFQVVNLLAKGRLRDVQPVGSVGKVQLFGGSDEIF